jgi:hypothetical protein
VNTRPTTTIVLAAILIVVVMGTALALTYGRPPESKFAANNVWIGLPAQSARHHRPDRRRPEGLVPAERQQLRVLDAQGRTSTRSSLPRWCTLGDVDGDGVEDIVAFAPITGESNPVLTVISKGAVLWTAAAQDMGTPVRAAVLRFKGGTQIIAGDARGQLRAFSARGEALWDAQLGSIADEGIRGLDVAHVGDEVLLAAANHDGSVAVYDEGGEVLWTYNYPSSLRRLRAYDLNGDNQGEVLLGGDANQLAALDAATGNYIFNQAMGQEITEIRAYELDGNPSSLELAVGGKDGGVWAIRPDGSALWSASLSGNKVTSCPALTSIATGPTGRRGQKTARWDSGQDRRPLTCPPFSRSAGWTSINWAVVRLVVADTTQVRALSVERVEAPFFYTPLVAG